jgi:hypothetical protein
MFSQNFGPSLAIRANPVPFLFRLELVEAAGNQITTLPAAVAACGWLKEVVLAGNPVIMLPAELGECKKLQMLDVSAATDCCSHGRYSLDLSGPLSPKRLAFSIQAL